MGSSPTPGTFLEWDEGVREWEMRVRGGVREWEMRGRGRGRVREESERRE